MRTVRACLYRAVGAAAAIWLSSMPVWAAGNWVAAEDNRFSYVDGQGNAVRDRWIYEAETNGWYYLDENGYRVQGRQELGGETYFFDGNGKMLTGWVYCPEGETPEPFTGGTDEEDIFYCGSDGKMARGWVEAYRPETAEYLDSDIFEGIQEDSYHNGRYYFKESGKICRNERRAIDKKRYVFDKEGACLTGWIYDYGEGAADRYLPVDTDSSDADKALCRENPQNLMYGLSGDASLAANRFIDAIPAWDDGEDDARSFYVDSSGYIVTAAGARGEGSSVAARRKATKIDEVGRYRLADWSTDVNITRIDGKYYCLEDSGTRIDGVIYLTGGEPGGEFGDGIYGFADQAAMQTGSAVLEHEDNDDEKDGYYYYYYFADSADRFGSKGRGITGVKDNRLYYLGLAVGAQNESCEVVYLPTLKELDERGLGTGFFLVDEAGRVKKGSKGGAEYTSSDGRTYRVTKTHDRCDDYGYVIEYYDGDKDEEDHKVWKALTEDDYAYLCWDIVEE